GGGNLEIVARTGGAGGYAQVGHGGRIHNGDKTGDIIVGKVDDLIIKAGNSGNSYAQLGHGGNDNATGDADGGIVGNIRVEEAGNIYVTGGGASAYALLGHGGLSYEGTVSDS